LVASPLGIWWCLLLNSVLSSDTRWYLSIFPSTSTPRAVCVSDEAMKRQESISTPPRDLRTRETSSTQSLLIGARRTSINKVVIAPIATQAQSLFVMIQQKGEGEVITRYWSRTSDYNCECFHQFCTSLPNETRTYNNFKLNIELLLCPVSLIWDVGIRVLTEHRVWAGSFLNIIGDLIHCRCGL
jgi:hypothetical protein